MDLAIIVVNWNVCELLAGCLASVYEELGRSGLQGRVWVVDNGSTDDSLALLAARFPEAAVIANEANIGFGAANNQGMAAASGDRPRYYFLLNPDTELRPGALAALVGCLDERPGAGLAGARLVYGDGRFQHSAFRFPGLVQLAYDLFPLPARWYESVWNGRYPRHLYRPDGAPFAVDCVLGATMLVRRDVAQATGGFDEGFHMYGEEIDWCWRLREAGWETYLAPAAEVVHFAGQSTSQRPARSTAELWRSRHRLYEKHHGWLTRLIASWLAAQGLRRQAALAPTEALREAYLEAASLWQ